MGNWFGFENSGPGSGPVDSSRLAWGLGLLLLGFFSVRCTAAEPRASITLQGPSDTVAVGQTFHVSILVKVQTDGFGAGCFDLSFDASQVELASAFNTYTLVQAPFNGITTGGLEPGRITNLGGFTYQSGHGLGEPAVLAVLPFRFKQAGVADFSVSVGDSGMSLLGGGMLDIETEVACAEPFQVESRTVNHAPSAQSQSVSVGIGQPIRIDLGGSDSDGDVLSPVLPQPGTDGYPQHGSLSYESESGPMPVAVVYTPHVGYVGCDSFEFSVSDGQLESAPATVSLEVGTLRNEIQVTTDQAVPYVTVAFGATPAASDGFSKASDGDLLAPPSGMDGQSVYFLLEDGTRLRDDVRQLQTSTVWKLLATIPSASEGQAWTLSWADTLDLPPGWSCTLTPVDAAWQAISGEAVDMTARTHLSLSNTSGALKTFRFALEVAAPEGVEYLLRPGWNLLGAAQPIAQTELEFNQLEEVLWVWNAAAKQYERPVWLDAGQAFWCYSTVEAPLVLNTVQATLESVEILPGWNMVCPSTSAGNPVDSNPDSVLAIWAWDPLQQCYSLVPAETDFPCQPTTGYWVYSLKSVQIW